MGRQSSQTRPKVIYFKKKQPVFSLSVTKMRVPKTRRLFQIIAKKEPRANTCCTGYPKKGSLKNGYLERGIGRACESGGG